VRVPGWARRLRAAAAGSAPASWVRRSLSVRIAVSMTAAAAVILVLFAAVTSAQLRSSVFENRRDIILDDASLRFSTAQSAFDQSTASTTDQVQEAAREVIETGRRSGVRAAHPPSGLARRVPHQ
jgi:two-component system sensor histidine kinase MtrB